MNKSRKRLAPALLAARKNLSYLHVRFPLHFARATLVTDDAKVFLRRTALHYVATQESLWVVAFYPERSEGQPQHEPCTCSAALAAEVPTLQFPAQALRR